MRTSCKAKAIPFPIRSVSLKPMQSRTAFPICAGNTDDGYSGRELSKDPVFEANACGHRSRKSRDSYRKGYVEVRAKLPASGNVHGNDFPTERCPLTSLSMMEWTAHRATMTLPRCGISLNEWLVRDTSKKIKAVKRSKGMSGKPITSKPVYGYLMGTEDGNFIIDEEAAPVVKQTDNLCLAGNWSDQDSPYARQSSKSPRRGRWNTAGSGGSTRRYHPGYECKWATNTVVHILENREYTGCLVNFKTEKLSYKVKHSVRKSPGKASDFREPPRAYHRHPDMGTGAGASQAAQTPQPL